MQTVLTFGVTKKMLGSMIYPLVKQSTELYVRSACILTYPHNPNPVRSPCIVLPTARVFYSHG